MPLRTSKAPSHWNAYRFNARIHKAGRKGCILIAGDAAHQTLPFAGQGLCSGWRDAANLGWKLPLAIDGKADPALLDTYQPEREPNVRGVIAMAMMMGKTVCITDPDAAAARDEQMLAARAAGLAPDGSPAYPPILEGRILARSPGAGTCFPQFQTPDGAKLYDLVCPRAWLISECEMTPVEGLKLVSPSAPELTGLADGLRAQRSLYTQIGPFSAQQRWKRSRWLELKHCAHRLSRTSDVGHVQTAHGADIRKLARSAEHPRLVARRTRAPRFDGCRTRHVAPRLDRPCSAQRKLLVPLPQIRWARYAIPMQRPLPQAADLYGDIEPSRRVRARDHIPGLIVAGLATLAAAALASRYGAPLTLMALLIGLSLNFLSSDPRLSPGLSLAARELLRIAIVLIGARITFAQVAALGAQSLAMVAATVAITITVGLITARALGLSAPRGLLAGGAVAICGGSAALAIAATLTEKRIAPADLALTLVGIATMSAAALILYPPLALALGLSNSQAGYMLGASIHDVAQAVGAGYAVSPEAGEIATIVKLARVALLAPVLAILTLVYPAQSDGPKQKVPLVPWFVLGFFAVAGLNSAGVIPTTAASAAGNTASALLALSVAATAIRTPLADVLKTGPRPLITIAAATLTSLALSLAYATLALD